jgi:Domain of unknown function (DUF1844)
MPEEKDEPSNFKVVDRRSFSGDGTRRGGPSEEENRMPKTPQPPSRERVDRIEPSFAEPADEAAPGFDTLVSYLSTTALFQLGLLPGPGGERIPADMLNARRTIDLLEILKEKTRNNLTLEEAKLLEDVLYELQLNFVEVDKRRGKSAR